MKDSPHFLLIECSMLSRILASCRLAKHAMHALQQHGPLSSERYHVATAMVPLGYAIHGSTRTKACMYCSHPCLRQLIQLLFCTLRPLLLLLQGDRKDFLRFLSYLSPFFPSTQILCRAWPSTQHSRPHLQLLVEGGTGLRRPARRRLCNTHSQGFGRQL